MDVGGASGVGRRIWSFLVAGERWSELSRMVQPISGYPPQNYDLSYDHSNYPSATRYRGRPEVGTTVPPIISNHRVQARPPWWSKRLVGGVLWFWTLVTDLRGTDGAAATMSKEVVLVAISPKNRGTIATITERGRS
ncbi:hypothetical protein L6452_18605 [Arctium lappa]|uniref:Uncharacterized protein n=1 Tax=Arctium lappa TaxID=4217 RepID=A0ACB9C6H9_ARCLA|nr:hypothetical protein L6452_18605 [Arctium lappa]